MNYPLEELLDRCIVLGLKIEHGQHGKATLDERGKFIAAIEEHHNPQISNWSAELTDIHRKIWNLEADIRLGKEKRLGLEEVGRRALAIRDLNRQRIQIKNRIAVATGGYFDVKINHASA